MNIREIQKNIAQSFFPNIDFEKYKTTPEYKSQMEEFVKMGVGGFYVLPAETDNVKSLIEQLQAIAETPLLFIGKINTGLSDIIPDGTDFPHSSALSKTNDLPSAFKIGKSIGREANEFGVKLLILEQCNTFNLKDIKSALRQYTVEVQRGIQSEKILTSNYHVGKYENFALPHSPLLIDFIGGGDTKQSNSIGAEVKIFTDNFPYTFENFSSYHSEFLGFVMETVPDWFSELSEENITKEILTVINNRFNAITRLKKLCGLLPRFAKLETSHSTMIGHQNIALKMALKASSVSDAKKILPFKEEIGATVFAFIDDDADMRSATRFYTMFAQASDNECDYAYIDTKITKDDIVDLQSQLQDTDLTLFLLFYKEVLDDAELRKISSIINALTSENVFVVNFGNPENNEMICPNNNITTFSDSFPSLAAAVTILFGRQEAVEKYY